jgi:hypothetical protein
MLYLTILFHEDLVTSGDLACALVATCHRMAGDSLTPKVFFSYKFSALGILDAFDVGFVLHVRRRRICWPNAIV